MSAELLLEPPEVAKLTGRQDRLAWADPAHVPQPQQIAEPAAVERKPLNAAERRSPPLTAEQIDEIHLTNSDAYERGDVDYESHGFARAIEAAHGITVEQGGA